jgi:hypothetical protein
MAKPRILFVEVPKEREVEVDFKENIQNLESYFSKREQ